MAPKTLPVVLKPNPQTITEGGLVTLTAEYTGPSTIDSNSVTFQWNVASGQDRKSVV